MSFCDSAALFLANHLGCLSFLMCWRKREKLQKLFEQSQKRIDDELDIVKVIKNIRVFKILLKTFLLNDNIKFEIAHQRKNIIDLEESEQLDDDKSHDGDEDDNRKCTKRLMRQWKNKAVDKVDTEQREKVRAEFFHRRSIRN